MNAAIPGHQLPPLPSCCMPTLCPLIPRMYLPLISLDRQMYRLFGFMFLLVISLLKPLEARNYICLILCVLPNTAHHHYYHTYMTHNCFLIIGNNGLIRKSGVCWKFGICTACIFYWCRWRRKETLGFGFLKHSLFKGEQVLKLIL